MKLQWFDYLTPGLFVGVLIYFTLVSIPSPDWILGTQNDGEELKPSFCHGDTFVYTTRDFSNPLNESEMEDLKEAVDQRYLEKGGTWPREKAGASGGGGSSGPSGNNGATTVSFGYFIDRQGVPHEWRGATGNREGMNATLARGAVWFNENAGSSVNVTCAGSKTGGPLFRS
ncbi:MAG: hypothetical protein LUQ25_06380 [Methanoregulaceae archaeon]|nr:hypothetical protein [Methanoregulaceae archaeon]